MNASSRKARPFLASVGDPWTWRMAWRDSRRSRARLALFAGAVAAGVAALVAMGSFSNALQRTVDEQARVLVGADVVVQASRPFTADERALGVSMSDAASFEVRFVSMALFPHSQGTRLVQVRAMEGGYPFYGALEPPSSDAAFRTGKGAIVDESLLFQFGEATGAEIKLGDTVLPIGGPLQKAPGEAFAFSSFAPRVYIPMRELERTHLLRQGSVASYRAYLKIARAERIAAAVEAFEARGFTCDTVAKRKKDLGQEMENLYRFLNLSGFVALLLGATAVAGAIHLHIRSRIRSVALLRCLGCSTWQAFTVYLIQAVALGITGSALGAVCGVAVQALLPTLFGDFLPVRIAFILSPASVLAGFAAGVTLCCLFAAVPLHSLRAISPLVVLRPTALAGEEKDRIHWVYYSFIAAGVTGFAVLECGGWKFGMSLSAGLAVMLAVLLLVSRGMIAAARRFLGAGGPYVWRQGLANLHRPGNRTTLLMLSLGLGTTLVLTTTFTQGMLLKKMQFQGGEGANMILFDVGFEQLSRLGTLLDHLHAPLIDSVPMVPMRLARIKSVPVAAIRKDPASHIKQWALDRDYRSSYRDSLSPTEALVKGAFTGRWQEGRGPVPVSLEKGIAEDLKVTVGDSITFDVQGINMEAVVGSIRVVDWKKFRTNFFVIFPAGVLEDAPTTYIVLTKAADAAQSAAIQREVVRQFPGVSILDIATIIGSVNSMLSKVAFVIRFLSAFTLVTGVMILAAALFSSRYERAREEALLRVLGATSPQVFQIMAVEFSLLGLFAVLAGICLSLAAAQVLATFVFKVPFSPPLTLIPVSIATMTAITLGAGLLISAQDRRRAPLSLLAAEA